jgi:SAM-dependent methyltransferase
MGPLLESQAELFAPLYERAMAWLAKERTEPGLIVDVGSGPGVVACLFAETFPGARVVAVDGSEPLLERARARADRQGFGDRFSTLTGELPEVLGELEYPADILWASRSLHHLGDQRAGLAAFAERLAPGGTLAIMEGGLPSRFLPRDFGIGRPGLEARIDAIEAEWFAADARRPPRCRHRDRGLARPPDLGRPEAHGQPQLPPRPARPGPGPRPRLRRDLADPGP